MSLERKKEQEAIKTMEFIRRRKLGGYIDIKIVQQKILIITILFNLWGTSAVLKQMKKVCEILKLINTFIRCILIKLKCKVFRTSWCNFSGKIGLAKISGKSEKLDKTQKISVDTLSKFRLSGPYFCDNKYPS